ncbi:MAG: sigma 54-interacting transcriptional regulator [Anaeromicrobium sp.]|uniref:sigma-54 interaction domain-containing protein n=1 Tax=Anaeromicrobium sp. TaxID=1929132 RepID=UPI0025DA2576|nr:sigma 54-interacting transcriptional regulator [Anaeromicrobium sp.]MCT4595974.1 sigma 54-interacting transcriptional regulator [Anaeromicrobium sp.]
MDKKLYIVDFNYEDGKNIRNQLNNLFEDNINIRCIEREELKNCERESLILVPHNRTFVNIKEKLGQGSSVIEANLTLSKESIDKIKNLDNNKKVCIFHENPEIMDKILCVIYNLTGKKLYTYKCENPHVCLDLNNEKKENFIGRVLLDLSTIIEVAVRFNIDYIIKNENIMEKYKEMITNESGFLHMLGRVNKFQSQLDILFKVIDEGVIIGDKKGIVKTFTDNCGEITGYKKKDVINRSLIELFPQIYFNPVLEDYIYIKEQLIKINGEDIIVSIYPIFHSNRMYGVVGLFKKFSELERKQHKIRAKLIGKGHRAKYNFSNIIGKSEKIEKCKEMARRMAKSNSSVLITGESGTGKELFAHAIHNSSDRKEYQFVAINCGALPESLLESELFGYEEGAFTGAKKGGKTGLLELAHRGTLFLDEIGEMPLKLQLRLLRVLQEKEVMRIGGDTLIKVDIRIIAATNRNLKEMVLGGQFREDLYFRLNVLPLMIPPLRTRTGDIIPLIEKMKDEFHSEFYFMPNAIDALLTHNWRGNVRELRNYIEYFTNIGLKKVAVKDLPFDHIGIYEEGLEEDDVIFIDKLKKQVGKGIRKYIFVLEELEKGQIIGKRMGRRSIYQVAKEEGIYISENEIRSILSRLEQFFMVEIYKGRGGTVITDFGKRALSYMKKG